MLNRRIIVLAILAGLTISGRVRLFAAPSAENVNLQSVAQKQAELDKQNEELRKKVLELEQKQAKQEAVAAAKTSAATSSTSSPTTPAPAPAGIQFKPYGWLKLDAAYDSHQTVAGDAALFVKPSSADGKRDLTFGARETRLGTYIVAPEYNGLKVTGRFEADFYGDFATPDKYTPRFRLGYFDVGWADGWSVVAGQDWDTYNTFHPLTNDAAILGDTGHLYGRHPLVRLSKETKIGDSTLTWKFAAQNGNNSQDLDADSQRDEAAATIPNFHVSGVLKTPGIGGKSNSFSLSGAYGQEKLADSAHPGRYDSKLVHASAQIPLGDPFTLQGVIWTGENLDTYLGGIGQGINVTQGKEVRASGGWLQGIVSLNKDTKWSLGYGIDNPNDKDLSGDARTLNDRLFTNIFYNLTDHVTLIGEYSYLTTKYATSGEVNDNRIQFGAKYSF